jgi:phosphatidate cytidylyltransferase
VAIALVPTLLGGPLFMLFMVALGIAGFQEYLRVVKRAGVAVQAHGRLIGMAVVAALGAAALLDRTAVPLLILSFIALAAPVVSFFPEGRKSGGLMGWAQLSVGSLYLGLPVYAATYLRSTPGGTTSAWLDSLAAAWSAASESTPRGLAWTLVVVIAIWIGDSAAYLGGRSFGRRKLAPALSPGKTVEGGIAGLLAAMLMVAAAFPLVGLGDPWLGLATGAALGLAGQVGDLAESFLKRQAGVKDTGDLIPGHGGVLDRIDALLFAFPVGLALATGYEGLGL